MTLKHAQVHGAAGQAGPRNGLVGVALHLTSVKNTCGPISRLGIGGSRAVSMQISQIVPASSQSIGNSRHARGIAVETFQ